MSPRADSITLPATEIRQSKGRKIYSFVVDGKQIHSFATVSRLRRGTDSKLDGYQRPEALAHIEDIRSYLEGPSPMIPNGIVVAFDSRVKFTPAKTQSLNTNYSTMGTLTIPTPREATDTKPGFIVDGQQRVAAIREAQIRQFPMVVTAFITDDIGRQTEQFILVNSTKPLPKGLLYELLPYTEARLPPPLHKRRLSAQLLEILNHTQHSPFFGLIQSPTVPRGIIKDNSVLRMLDQSLSDGALFSLRRTNDGAADLTAMSELLFAFWWAIYDVFSDAWNLPPRKSRLMHGAGIISVGNIMDHIGVPRVNVGRLRAYYAERVAPLASVCAWVEGSWGFRPTPRKWNDIQNTRQDVALLTDYLQRQFDVLAERVTIPQCR